MNQPALKTEKIYPDDVSRLVMLVFGNMEKSGHYWCYVAVKPSRYDEFRRIAASKTYNIQNFIKDAYGEVIVSGEGVTPPTQVTKQVAYMLGLTIRELFSHTDAKEAVWARLKDVLDLDGQT